MRISSAETVYWTADETQDLMLQISALDADGKSVQMGAGGYCFFETSEGGKSLPPRIGILGSEDLFTMIGRFILLWSAFEKVHTELVEKVLSLRTAREPGWQKRPFTKRNELLKVHWKEQFQDHKPLIECVETAMARAYNAKQLRDAIAHKEMQVHMDPDDQRGASIRFTDNPGSHKASSKPYFLSDIRKCVLQVTESAGELEWLMGNQYALPFPSCCISAAQGLRREATA